MNDVWDNAKPILHHLNLSKDSAHKKTWSNNMKSCEDMGITVYDTTLPVLKQNNAILAFKGKEAQSKPVTDCIRCGRCVRACPMSLTPAEVSFAIKNPKAEELSTLNVMYCLECGSCAFVCPAGKPLTAVMRLAKNEVRKAGK